METVGGIISELWVKYADDVREGYILHRIAEDRRTFPEFGNEFSRQLSEYAWKNYAEAEGWERFQRDWREIIRDGLRAGVIEKGDGSEAE